MTPADKTVTHNAGAGLGARAAVGASIGEVMSSIVSGTGLISGLPTSQIIDALISAQSKPKELLTARLTTLQTQRSSLLELNARLLALMGTTSRLKDAKFFNQFAANSSDESVLTATASSGALPGVVDLVVKSLVASHQMISGGFPDGDTATVGVGQLSIEIGQGGLSQPTPLGDLNGGAGVRRGRIQITDRAGGSAEIDLTAVVTVEDVLDRINTAGGIDVRARVSGNHLVLEDLSGGTGTLSVTDARGGFTAVDLGIRQSLAAGELNGTDILYLSDATELRRLNDGNGVRRGVADDFAITNTEGNSFNVRLDGVIDDATRLAVLNHGAGVRLGTIRITNRLGASGIVDLTGAETVGDVRTRIEAAVDDKGASLNIGLSAVGIGGVGSLTIRDKNTPPKPPANETQTEETKPKFVVEDVNGYAARDLGIAGSTTTDSILGNGIHRVTTIGDVVRAINYAAGNDGTVVASLTANGIRLADTSSATGPTPLTVEALADGRGGLSKAAADLGIEGALASDFESRDLLAGLNTVLLHSLNGGAGLELGTVSFRARDGSAPVTVDFAGAQTVQDVLERINANVPGVEATLNAVGHGIAIADTTGQALSALEIADVSGTLAATLGLAGAHAQAVVNGGNLQRQYLNELTGLSGLNGGRGVRTGDLEVRNSRGEIFVVKIDSAQKTLGDVIQAINEAGQTRGVAASINATGDGIAVLDAAGGDQPLTITDRDGGSTAADLRIAGEASAGETRIDGTFEIHVDVDADDSLEDVAAKIRNASPDLHASVLNDGASALSYRLSVTSGVTGTRGALLFDAGTTGLNMNTLVAAQDAVVLVGGRDAASPIVVSSSTNTISGVIPGVEIDLHGVSDDTVSLSTTRDIERIVSDLNTFVTNYNAVMDRIDQATSFDPETQKRGPLLGESTVSLVENRLARTVIRRFPHAPQGLQTLSAVGITFGDGGRLSFDEEVFREKYAQDPQGVERLFTAADSGVGAVLHDVLEELTNDTDGVLTRRDGVLGSQVEDVNERITNFDAQLALRRAQLERQYANLESILAGMQDQQTALSQLSNLLNS